MHRRGCARSSTKYRKLVSGHDSNPGTCSFLNSPESGTAFADAGRIDFNRISDWIPVEGKSLQLRFTASSVGLPIAFTTDEDLHHAPVENAAHTPVHIDPRFERLQLLHTFKIWEAGSATNMPGLQGSWKMHHRPYLPGWTLV
jgi:aconitate hydratase